MRIAVIIPTYNAGAFLEPLLESLRAQTLAAEIVVVDSGSTDDTVTVAQRFAPHVCVRQIPHEQFDHGGTRDAALRQTDADAVVFLTQDVLPTDERLLEKLVAPLDDLQVAAAFGRQVARADAPAYERLIREFNYPAQGRVWNAADIDRLGVKAYFFSDVCAVYRRSAYEAVGGFDAPLTTNEDMLMAAKLLKAGFALAYAADACVWHSHRLTLGQDYRRNKAIGYEMERYRDRLADAHTNREGVRMVRAVSVGLLRALRVGSLAAFAAHCAARLAGNRRGRAQARAEARS